MLHAPSPAHLAALIDHTLLDRDAATADLDRVCDEAREHDFFSVCVYPAHVARVARRLSGSRVLPITVVGFPEGEERSVDKAAEAMRAVADGAREIDMVLNRGLLVAADHAAVWRDIALVVAAAAPFPVKVILETAALGHDEKVLAAGLAKAAGARFVKTSTGFGPGGATTEDVALLRRVVGGDMGVKASGGIRSLAQVLSMLEAGADRIGSSASVAIMREATPTVHANPRQRGPQ